jgi:hypothetical protein
MSLERKYSEWGREGDKCQKRKKMKENGRKGKKKEEKRKKERKRKEKGRNGKKKEEKRRKRKKWKVNEKTLLMGNGDTYGNSR